MYTYTHTQRGPLWWILALVGLVLVAIAWVSTVPAFVQVILGAVAATVVLVALCFASLTIEDRGEVLRVRYGPIPLFRFHFRYGEISSVAIARSDIIDGWGIHYVPTRGWIYNLWGFDCVRLTHRGRPVRIGTDDPEGLTAHLRRKAGLADAEQDAL